MKGDLKFAVFAAVPSDIGRKLGAFLAWSPALAPVGGAGLGLARAADAAQGGGGDAAGFALKGVDNLGTIGLVSGLDQIIVHIPLAPGLCHAQDGAVGQFVSKKLVEFVAVHLKILSAGLWPDQRGGGGG